MGMHRHKGFTLLELLVAVVVLGVVLTLGVPAFTAVLILFWLMVFKPGIN